MGVIRTVMLLICSDLHHPEPWGSRDALSLALSSLVESNRRIFDHISTPQNHWPWLESWALAGWREGMEV